MSTLRKLNEAEVASSEGYRVKYGRETLTYSDGNRYVIVPIEHLGEPYELAVYLDMVAFWMIDGRPAEMISPPDQDIIEKRIRDCLTFLGRNYSVRK